jgi:hypothetical protein
MVGVGTRGCPSELEEYDLSPVRMVHSRRASRRIKIEKSKKVEKKKKE